MDRDWNWGGVWGTVHTHDGPFRDRTQDRTWDWTRRIRGRTGRSRLAKGNKGSQNVERRHKKKSDCGDAVVTEIVIESKIGMGVGDNAVAHPAATAY